MIGLTDFIGLGISESVVMLHFYLLIPFYDAFWCLGGNYLPSLFDGDGAGRKTQM